MPNKEQIALAINRVADALFQQAKVQGRQLKLQERQVAVQEELLELQAVNLSVTRQLEAKLAAQVQLEADCRAAALGEPSGDA